MEKQLVFFRKGLKVALRPILKEDAHQFFIWMNDPEITQYLARNLPVSFEEEERWCHRKGEPNEKDFTLAVTCADNGQLLGVMGLHQVDYRSRTATTGAVIGNKEFRGKGYGSEAKMLLLQFAFRELNLRKIYSHVIEYNAQSLAYSKKCGYVEEARLPKHMFKDGEYRDQIILAVYRETWEPLWKEFSSKLGDKKE
jgi:RimJ/RimL family protein N-acetyltransferase